MYSPLTKTLIDALCGLPGVGPKSASRIAYQLLAEKNRQKATTLKSALTEAIDMIGLCQHCRQFTEETICRLCSSPKRDQSRLCVVESPADVIALEQSHAYQGRYFVLHGHLSPLDGINAEEIAIPLLLSRLEETAITEVILATNPTAEGRATALYIANHIKNPKIQCTRIAHGVPIGGELEYLDGGTLSHAFQSRQSIQLENNLF